MKDNKITFCTISMNRLHHIEKTLLKNILDNYNYSNCEFLLLDYNSSDHLEDYVQDHLTEYINNGKLNFYRTILPTFFHRAHALNTAFILASGDIVCNIDADNYTGESFAFYVNECFNKNKSIYLTVDPEHHSSDVCGRVCSRKADFLKIGGYDETMDGWGHDDDDIKNRLQLLGLQRMYIEGDQFLNAIRHGNEDRVSNEYTLKFLDSIYISYINPASSCVLILLTNNEFSLIFFINNRSRYSSSYENCINGSEAQYYIDIDEEEGICGKWAGDSRNVIDLVDDHDGIWRLLNKDEFFLLEGSNKLLKFFQVGNRSFIEDIVRQYSFAKNRSKLRCNIASNIPLVNIGKSIGEGIVYKNFMNLNPIKI